MDNERVAMRAYFFRLLEIVAIILLMFLLFFAFAKVLTYILPFVIGFVIAVALLPLVKWLEKTGIPRNVAIIVVMVVVLGGLSAVLVFLAFRGTEEAVNLGAILPHYFSKWRNWAESAIQQGMSVYAHLPSKMVSAVQSTTNSAVDQVRVFAVGLLTGIFTDVALLPSFIVILIISIIASYFIMAERDALVAFTRRILPPGWAPKLRIVVTDVSRAISGLLRAQLVLIAVTVVVGIVGLAIMRIGYSLILGTAIGLTGWVPIVGSGLITFPWALGALVMGNYILAIKVLLLQGIATSIRHIIEPKLLASNMGLGTFPTLIGMYIGLTSMGVLGIVLGPIMIIALRSLIRADIFSDILPERSTVERKEDSGGKERNS